MAEELIVLASQFSQRMGGGVPVAVCTEPMSPGEEGFSGAKLLRLRCTYADGGEATYVAKHTTWQERAAMQTFTGQGAGLYPSRLGHPGSLPGGRLALAGGRQPQPALAHGHFGLEGPGCPSAGRPPRG